jgi:peroxiredoxin
MRGTVRMSRRNTYLAGAAAIAAGVVLIAIAVVATSGDGGGGPAKTGSEQAGTDQDRQASPAGEGDGQKGSKPAQDRSLSGQLDRRRTVRAPGFDLQVIDQGSAPAQGRAPLENAVADGSLSLAKLRGSPVVLHVWSSECGPCRADARLIETTWQRWGRRGVAVLGVSVDEPADKAQQFARQYDLSYPLLHDEGGRVAEAYGVTSLPETFFISSSGEVVGQVSGSPSVRQMEVGAAAARAGRAFGSEQGGSRVPRG